MCVLESVFALQPEGDNPSICSVYLVKYSTVRIVTNQRDTICLYKWVLLYNCIKNSVFRIACCDVFRKKYRICLIVTYNYFVHNLQLRKMLIKHIGMVSARTKSPTEQSLRHFASSLHRSDKLSDIAPILPVYMRMCVLSWSCDASHRSAHS